MRSPIFTSIAFAITSCLPNAVADQEPVASKTEVADVIGAWTEAEERLVNTHLTWKPDSHTEPFTVFRSQYHNTSTDLATNSPLKLERYASGDEFSSWRWPSPRHAVSPPKIDDEGNRPIQYSAMLAEWPTNAGAEEFDVVLRARFRNQRGQRVPAEPFKRWITADRFADYWQGRDAKSGFDRLIVDRTLAPGTCLLYTSPSPRD